MASLEEYAAENPPGSKGPKPFCCELSPETWAEINAARDRNPPVQWKVIALWLIRERGVARSADAVRHGLHRHRSEHV